MPNPESDRKATAKQAKGAIQVGESSIFDSILGSRANSKAFHWLMQHMGNYLFTINLLFLILKLGISFYQYVTSPTKTIHETGDLGWNILRAALISTAVIGSLALASLFMVITPIVFVSTMTADTLSNIGHFFWNIKKFFQQSSSEDAKKEASKKIKEYAFSSIIGFIMTAAVSIIFLFPEIGLGAVGAAGFVFLGVPVTVAGITGVVASIALAAASIPLFPAVYQLAKQGATNILNGIKRAYSFFRPTINLEKSKEPTIDKKKSQARFEKAMEEACQPKPTIFGSVAMLFSRLMWKKKKSGLQQPIADQKSSPAHDGIKREVKMLLTKPSSAQDPQEQPPPGPKL